jgi:hypothetical protein
MTGEGVPRGAQNTIDWNYQKMFQRAHDSGTGLASLGRWIATITKQNQMTLKNIPDNRGHPRIGDNAFSAHRNGLYQMYQGLKDQKNRGYSDPTVVDEVMQAYLSSWLRFVYQYDISDFPRSDTDRNAWNQPDTQPKCCFTSSGRTAAQNTYSALIKYPEKFDINASTLDSLARWGRDMWADPVSWTPPWETWIIGEGTIGDFALELTGDAVQTTPATWTFGIDESLDPTTFDEVRWYVNGTLEETQTVEPFAFTWTVSDLSEAYEVYAQIDIGGLTDQSTSLFIQSLAEWNTQRLTGRARGLATASLNRPTDFSAELTADGINQGLYRRDLIHQGEAAESCALGDEIDFDISSMNVPSGAGWARSGLHVQDDSIYVAIDYLPLQERVRVLYESAPGVWPTEVFSTIAATLPLRMRVLLEEDSVQDGVDETGTPIFIDQPTIRLDIDKNQDGSFDTVYELEVSGVGAPFSGCEWSLTTTSRREGQNAEAVFTNIVRKEGEGN